MLQTCAIFGDARDWDCNFPPDLAVAVVAGTRSLDDAYQKAPSSSLMIGRENGRETVTAKGGGLRLAP